jgi:crossover junction endodeoxyribonuclease RuvC
VALFIAAERRLPIAGYAPATVKQSVVGHGRASKDQVAYLVRALLSLRRVPEPDAADALAIAICHARASQGQANVLNVNVRRGRAP